MRTLDRALADAGWALAWLIGRSLRWQEQGREHLAAARAAGRPVLFVFWHSRLLHVCYRLAREGPSTSFFMKVRAATPASLLMITLPSASQAVDIQWGHRHSPQTE